MAFFPLMQKITATGYTRGDLNYAIALRCTLRRHGKVQRPVSAKAWARSMSKLRTVDALSQETIEDVFLWYLDHFGERRVPWAFSAKSFRAKFYNIQMAMKIHQERNPTVVITETARQAAKRLGRRYWAKGSGGQLPLACQRSLEALDRFNAKLKAYVATGGSDPKVHSLARFITPKMTNMLFIDNWFHRIHELVNGWEAWSGDLNPFIFSPENKQFRSLGHSWCRLYGMDAKVWDKLMETLQ